MLADQVMVPVGGGEDVGTTTIQPSLFDPETSVRLAAMRGVTAGEAADGALDPTALVATTVNV